MFHMPQEVLVVLYAFAPLQSQPQYAGMRGRTRYSLDWTAYCYCRY
jgi:hypothetical protein